MPAGLEDAIVTAREALRASDRANAWQALRGVLGYPGDAVQERGAFQRGFGAFAQLAGAVGGPELAQRIYAIVARPDDPQALYDAAWMLYEQQAFGLAATLLARANARAPGQQGIVTELSACLEALGLYPQAALTVDLSGLPEKDPLCAYLSGFNWLMSGDLDQPRVRLAAIAGVSQGPAPELRAGLAGMLARADALLAAGVTLDERALTAWHAVIHGAALLHESPHGHDEPMHGRYAYLGDQPGLMREGLDRLAAVLACRTPLPQVVPAPDRASHILALAAAERLGLPLGAWQKGTPPRGLVVAWTLEAVANGDFHVDLERHAPEQVLFVHASCWTAPFPYAPDVTTLLYQHITHPSTGGALRVDPETGDTSPQEADPRADAILAAEILAAEPGDPSARPLQDVLAVVRALADLPEEHRGSLHRGQGHRRHQRAGGPVASARFT
ncbi:MAG: hypothetical protein ABIO70_30565 [Pseudomonadota bacterium]